jgi:hypothetical protein
MIRPLAFAALAAFVLTTAAAAEEPKATETVNISSSIEDPVLIREAPPSGVIVSQKTWEKLAATWEIKDVPKVDFTKEILIVGTWRGTSFKFLNEVKNGDLTIELIGDKDVRPGFRYKIISVQRDGIKSVGGKELPKE